jgi:hypothetical protein
MSTLLLPHGIRPKRVSEISVEEMAWLASAEDVLRKLKMTIVCLQCKTPIHGANHDTDATLSVSCECRRLTYRARADASM